MTPEWDINQHPDHAAVTRLAETVCQLPSLTWSLSLAGDAGWPSIEGESFRARLYAVPDRVGDRLQLHIHFERLGGAGAERPWEAWVRCCNGQPREDRITGKLARQFQKAFPPAKVTAYEVAEGKVLPRFVRTAHWWVSGGSPGEQDDITAQIWLFLLQTGVVQESAAAVARYWLWEYLERSFRMTPEEASYALTALLTRYWRPLSARSWRTYIGIYLYRHPERAARRGSGIGTARPSVSENDPDCFTVAEAARFLDIAPSTLYDWLQEGRVKPVTARPVRGRTPVTLILRAELERVKIEVRPKVQDLIALRQGLSGSSYEAARKWVRRQQQRGLDSGEIAQLAMHLGRKRKRRGR